MNTPSIPPELRQWILAQAQAGQNAPALLAALVQAGWQEAQALAALQAVLHTQVDSLARAQGLPASLPAWRRPLPFLWESTGVETHFTNGLDPEPRARGVFAFFRPEPSSPKRLWKTCRQR